MKQEITIQGNINPGYIIYLPEIAEKSNLEITINSSGGSGEATIGMFDMLEQRRKKQKIITIGLGQVESAAMWPFVCGNERWSYEHTTYMFHNGVMNATNMKMNPMSDGIIKKFEIIFVPLIKRLVEISNKDFDFWKKILTGEEVYFSAKEMKKMGIVTKIIK